MEPRHSSVGFLVISPAIVEVEQDAKDASSKFNFAHEDNGEEVFVAQPTDWFSNILVKEKPNGKLRMCIDPSQTINKAIRRPKCTIRKLKKSFHN